jgi:hypothetical protein
VSGEDTHKLISDMLTALTEAEVAERGVRFFMDQALLWNEINSQVRKEVLSKASWIATAQFVLLAAALLIAGLVALAVL